MIKLIILFIILSFNLYSQQLDSLKSVFLYKPKPSLRLDTKNAFVSNTSVVIRGVQVGAEFNKKVILGIGLYTLWSDINRTLEIQEKTKKYLVDSKLSYTFYGLFAEYTFYNTEKWEFTIPIQLGLGTANYFYTKNNDNTIVYTKNHFILSYDTNISGIYKFVYWFGAGVGVGYRLILYDDNLQEDNFNSPIYLLRISIPLGEIYNRHFGRIFKIKS